MRPTLLSIILVFLAGCGTTASSWIETEYTLSEKQLAKRNSILKPYSDQFTRLTRDGRSIYVLNSLEGLAIEEVADIIALANEKRVRTSDQAAQYSFFPVTGFGNQESDGIGGLMIIVRDGVIIEASKWPTLDF